MKKIDTKMLSWIPFASSLIETFLQIFVKNSYNRNKNTWKDEWVCL